MILFGAKYDKVITECHLVTFLNWSELKVFSPAKLNSILESLSTRRVSVRAVTPVPPGNDPIKWWTREIDIPTKWIEIIKQKVMTDVRELSNKDDISKLHIVKIDP